MIGAPAAEQTTARGARVVRRAPGSAIRDAGGGERRDVVSLALGEPTWPLATDGWEALARVDRCAYGPHSGEPALREAVAAYEGVDPERVLITAGAQAGLFAIAQTFLGPGDAALVPDPGFPAYRSVTELAGARAVPYGLAEDRRFDLDAERLLETLEHTPQARVVFLNHPSNPTGGIASRAALRQVAEECSHRGLLLVSDEVYRELYFGAAPTSLRSVSDTGLLLGSVSKAWSAPGLRVGWMTGAPELLAACRAVHALMTTSAAGPSQAAACALIEARDSALPAARRELRERWEALATAWSCATGRAPERPRGGMYGWYRVGGDDAAFCRKAREIGGVALVPGSAFGVRGRGFVRLSLGADPATIRRGVARLLRCWETQPTVEGPEP